ncbi:unnamed protein product [Lactuca virosa]|uniref:Secreted protein n=1 Tax=Lactuca virosa TaxID=75947 RepID=A0AAU9P9N5_9ASTR|nr:unnamed protein product [Lactuca virosa]
MVACLCFCCFLSSDREREKFTTLAIQACGGNYIGETRFEKKVIIQMRTASLITKSHHHCNSRHLQKPLSLFLSLKL